ncbi:FHA domain-containing protein [Demequina lignilytica]|uniref:FHA domain-containing protein n=1 Tax=Demequina lignilytica TaxID=3051663 RepID=A0AB35MHV4_9MICO|nr:FHA domain-containing protein [Demequina sp. SYSU T0a273]MDN4483380.1 FHA domain-containing protein [Demequina sp. SYSU T0a273]
MIPEPLFYAAVGYAVAFVVGYVWMGLTLGAVYRKFGARPSRAWIPVLRYAEVATLTQSGTAGVIVVRLVAALAAAASAVGILMGSATGDALAIGGLGVASVAALAAWVLWILHIHRLGLDHALSAGYTVLGALLPWLWSAIVGWGPAGASTATGPIPLVASRAAAGVDTADEPEVPEVTPPGPDAAEERPVPDDAPVEAAPTDAVPTDTVPTDTVPIAVRRSPYASLAPRDADEAPQPVRRSPFADLAPPADIPPAQEPAPATPTFLVVPPLPAPPTEDLPVAEPAAQAGTEGVASVAPVEPDAPADAPAALPGPDATPAGPVSPYMRGGAAAPPAAPSMVPSFALPVAVEPEPTVEPEAEPEPETEPVPTPSPEPAPAPAPDVPREATPASSPAAARITLPPAEPIAPPPPAPPRAAEAPPTVLEPAPGDGGAPAWAGGAAFPGMAGAAASSADAPAQDDAAEDDRTQVAARVRERWELVTAEGRAYPLTPPAVLVGRPGGFPPLDGTPRLDIDDTTRTVSKSHARLALDQGRWTVEDLGSTNGTYLIDAHGGESQVEPGAARVVEGRLAFGDVELELRRRDGA